MGFSKGSRIPAEFDVTNLICDGANMLCVKVFTYSDGTYLENQDMLLASGIFRDVMLYNLNDISVWDYSVRTQNNRVYVDVTLSGQDFANVELSAEIDGQKVLSKAKAENSFSFMIDSPNFWNAEEPFTYKLVLTLTKDSKIVEIHTKIFGFGTFQIRF